MYPELAAAGLWTTPTDLARFAMGIQRGALLGPALTRELFTLQASDYGLGLILAGDGASQRFHHGGVNEGFEGDWIGYVHGGRAASVMANATGALGLVAEVIDAIARENGWPGYPPHEQLVDAALDAATLALYTGRYANAEGSTLTIDVVDGRLSLELGDGSALRIVPAPALDYFYVARWNRRIDFLRSGAGNATMMIIGKKTELRRVE